MFKKFAGAAALASTLALSSVALAPQAGGIGNWPDPFRPAATVSAASFQGVDAKVVKGDVQPQVTFQRIGNWPDPC